MEPESEQPSTPEDVPPGQTVETPPSLTPEVPVVEPPPGFDFKPSQPGVAAPHDSVQLLPFSVRMSKIARVVGVAEDDAMFDELRLNRYQLGDYNFAESISPDDSWRARRMALWTKSLRPVCTSDAFTSRYAELPGSSLDELVREAYGREADAQDHAIYSEVLAELPLSADASHQAVCLTVLSSLEFLAN